MNNETQLGYVNKGKENSPRNSLNNRKVNKKKGNERRGEEPTARHKQARGEYQKFYKNQNWRKIWPTNCLFQNQLESNQGTAQSEA